MRAKFILVGHLKTAIALGLTIPSAQIARAGVVPKEVIA